MTDTLPVKTGNTTHVVGYYNKEKWPVQLVISKLNVTLNLQPGGYVEDPNRNKINDPIFESYVGGNGKPLARAISDTPVPLRCVVVQRPLSEPGAGTNPVRAATGFAVNKQGLRVPVMPKPVAPAPNFQAQVGDDTRNPVTPMTMDQARKLGLVRKIREVPEDYGETDGTGRPSSNPPPIKYSIDPSMMRQAPALPEGLLKVGGKTPDGQPIQHIAERTSLISQLTSSAAAPATPDSASVFLRNTTTIPPGMTPGLPPRRIPVVIPPVAAQQPVQVFTDEAAGDDAAVLAEADQALPEPEMDDEMMEPEIESTDQPEPDPVEEPAPAAPPPATAKAAPALKPVTAKNKFTCSVCNSPFKFASQLMAHARTRHPNAYDHIMGPYSK